MWSPTERAFRRKGNASTAVQNHSLGQLPRAVTFFLPVGIWWGIFADFNFYASMTSDASGSSEWCFHENHLGKSANWCTWKFYYEFGKNLWTTLWSNVQGKLLILIDNNFWVSFCLVVQMENQRIDLLKGCCRNNKICSADAGEVIKSFFNGYCTFKSEFYWIKVPPDVIAELIRL